MMLARARRLDNQDAAARERTWCRHHLTWDPPIRCPLDDANFELAPSRPIGYRLPVFRRVASFLALLALLAAPAVTSTRLFCRFTGQEFVGCLEASRERGVQVRPDDCCDQRTFRALDGMRLAETQPQPAPATVLVTDAVTPLVIASAATPSVRPERSVQPVGPPVFLMQRALLI